MSEADLTQSLFVAKYAQEKAAITRLEAVGRERLGPGAADNLKLLGRLASDGVQRVLATRRSPSGRSEVETLIQQFILYGAKAALLTGAQRGGDFLNNQLRGRWAERVTASMPLEGLRLVEFGPSGAAMPGEEDHREVVMTFMEIHLLEGKRPDLLAFDVRQWQALTDAERQLVSEWPKRRLNPADEGIVKKARCGVEVKNSAWHYGRRRAAGGGPLSITVKAEEVDEIESWSHRTGLPIVFVQVLFDELYCMSFRRMVAAIARGHVYAPGDYELDGKTGEKLYHKFHIAPPRHLCGRVVFPSESTAEVRVLGDGSVVPYIDFKPATAEDVVTSVVTEEIDHVEPPAAEPSTPPGSPPNQTP